MRTGNGIAMKSDQMSDVLAVIGHEDVRPLGRQRALRADPDLHARARPGSPATRRAPAAARRRRCDRTGHPTIATMASTSVTTTKASVLKTARINLESMDSGDLSHGIFRYRGLPEDLLHSSESVHPFQCLLRFHFDIAVGVGSGWRVRSLSGGAGHLLRLLLRHGRRACRPPDQDADRPRPRPRLARRTW